MKILSFRLLATVFCGLLSWTAQTSAAEVSDQIDRKIKVQHTRTLPQTFQENAFLRKTPPAYSTDAKPLENAKAVDHSTPKADVNSAKSITKPLPINKVTMLANLKKAKAANPIKKITKLPSTENNSKVASKKVIKIIHNTRIKPIGKLTKLSNKSARIAYADDTLIIQPNVPAEADSQPKPGKEGIVISGNPEEFINQSDEHCAGNDFGSLFNIRPGYLFAGVEYLYVRPHFSEPTAYTLSTDPGVFVNGQRQITHEAIPYNYNYESSFRTYIGYRLCDCCADFKLSYTRLAGSDTKQAQVNGNAVPGFFELTPQPGETLESSSNVYGHIADAAFSRCIELGDECQSFDACPRWDLRWKAGLRFANIGNERSGRIINDPDNANWNGNVDFRGAGPIVGLEGRRYFGSHGQFSLYSNWDTALLIGQYEDELNTRISAGQNTLITTWKTTVTRTIPMMGIEMGAAWQPNDCWTLSAGWMFQAWWDMGMTDDFPDDGHIRDDANIMSWDGLTLRAELSF